MPSWKEWEEYFEKKNLGYLKQQNRDIGLALDMLDKKIIKEFQLDYLNIVKNVIRDVIAKKEKNGMGMVTAPDSILRRNKNLPGLNFNKETGVWD